MTSHPHRRWLLPVVGASVMVAIIGGAVIGLMLRGGNESHAQSKLTPTSTAGKADPKKAMNAAIADFEKSRKQKIEETRYQAPGKNGDQPLFEKMVQGVQWRAELMRFYVMNLDEKDDATTAKAHEFAQQEIKAEHAPEPYRCVGYVGEAVLLAYEGKHKESYDMLEKAFALRVNGNPKRMLQSQMLRNKDVVELLMLVIKMNEKNLPLPAHFKPLKEELEKAERGIPPDKNRPNKPSP